MPLKHRAIQATCAFCWGGAVVAALADLPGEDEYRSLMIGTGIALVVVLCRSTSSSGSPAQLPDLSKVFTGFYYAGLKEGERRARQRGHRLQFPTRKPSRASAPAPVLSSPMVLPIVAGLVIAALVAVWPEQPTTTFTPAPLPRLPAEMQEDVVVQPIGRVVLEPSTTTSSPKRRHSRPDERPQPRRSSGGTGGQPLPTPAPSVSETPKAGPPVSPSPVPTSAPPAPPSAAPSAVVPSSSPMMAPVSPTS